MGFYQTQYLYVAEFKNGVVKVGRTGSHKRRRESLKQPVWFKSPMVRFHACAGTQSAEVYEFPLIERLDRMSCGRFGREWFKGLRFSVAVQLAEQMTRAARVNDAKA